jgi:hypothetical protein
VAILNLDSAPGQAHETYDLLKIRIPDRSKNLSSPGLA